jgi:hypothetical protein
VDSGADSSVFPAAAAAALGIRLEDGEETPLRGFVKNPENKPACVGWRHSGIGFALRPPEGDTVIAVVGDVVFAEELSLSGILGRRSFFRQFRVCVDEAEEKVVLDLRPGLETIDPSAVPKYLHIHAESD